MSDREDELSLALIAERIKSLRDISEANFGSLKRAVERLDELPVKVERLEGQMGALKERVDDLEETGTRGIEFRRGTLPIILLTLALVLTGLGTVLTQVH